MLVELVPVSLTVTFNLFFIVEINHQITINYLHMFCNISELWNCYILDLATSQWKTMRTPYTGRRLPTLVYNEYHDKLFYFSGANDNNNGGNGNNGVLDRVVEKYSFDVGEIVGWQSVNEPPEALPISSGVSEGHFLYLHSIWISSEAGSETKLLSMDIRTEQWTYHDTAVNGMYIL